MNVRRVAWSTAAALVSLGLGLLAAAPLHENGGRRDSLLTRRYHEGEKIVYQMRAANQDRVKRLEYSATADGVVKKDPAGNFIEEFAWRNLEVNGTPVNLPESSITFRQILSLPPSTGIKVPDLGKVYPMLIGPVTDLLTFYADLQIVAQGGSLARPGDHFYYKYGTPASWADGMHVLTGEDSIDFDVTLAELNEKASYAVLIVKHVPPVQPQIKLTADWMHAPVADTPNNWVEISKTADGTFAAAIGKETFEARIKVGLAAGNIISADLENSVDVRERGCSDAALTACSEPMRYPIHRHITIAAEDAKQTLERLDSADPPRTVARREPRGSFGR